MRRPLDEIVRDVLVGANANAVGGEALLSDLGVGLAEMLRAGAYIAGCVMKDDPGVRDEDFPRIARAAANGLLVGLIARQQETAAPTGRRG
jgi:hypothetical protein